MINKKGCPFGTAFLLHSRYELVVCLIDGLSGRLLRIQQRKEFIQVRQDHYSCPSVQGPVLTSVIAGHRLIAASSGSNELLRLYIEPVLQ